MTLDEKIDGRIERKLEEMAQLFSDVDDTAADGLELADLITSQAPLLQDIKMEIKQLQNNQIPLPVEEQEPEDDPGNDTSPSDPEVPALRQALRDAIKGLDKTKRITGPERNSNLPDSKIPDWVKGVPWYNIVSDIFKFYELGKFSKEMDDKYGTIIQQIQSVINGDTTIQEFIENQLEQGFDGLREVLRIMGTDLESLITQTYQLGQNMSENMADCCNAMNTGLINLPSFIQNGELGRLL